MNRELQMLLLQETETRYRSGGWGEQARKQIEIGGFELSGPGQRPDFDGKGFLADVEEPGEIGKGRASRQANNEQVRGNQQLRSAGVSFGIQQFDLAGRTARFGRMAKKNVRQLVRNGKPLPMRMVIAVDADEVLPGTDDRGKLVRHRVEADDAEPEPCRNVEDRDGQDDAAP